MCLMAEAIADMGEAGDAMLLVPLLNHPSGDVRHAGCSGMDKLTAKIVILESSAMEGPRGQPEEKESSGIKALPSP